jgi:two-component system, OmpR family, sensor histidine kinase KdpD
MNEVRWPKVPAPFALPVGAALLLVVGAVAAAVHGRMSALVVSLACGVIVAAVSAAADPAVLVPLTAVGWLTASSFAHPPYGALDPSSTEAATAAIVVGGSAVAGATVGVVARLMTARPRRVTLDDVGKLSGLANAVDRRRQWGALGLAVVALPVLTVTLTSARGSLSLADELLLYLTAVVAVAVVGGFWPAIAAATAASLLVNWYFTEPIHTFTIAKPDNLLALLLFVVVAVTVASVVHLAAGRSIQARQSRAEAEALLHLARTVLAGDDTAAEVLGHLHAMTGTNLQLLELVGERWVPIASVGDGNDGEGARMPVRDDLTLVVHGSMSPHQRRLLEAGAGQAAAAVDRNRLRTQASQTEALAAGNRMRTALLAAVSHDLRTPLASIKAGISGLRQTDVQLTPGDESELLETIEGSTDKLGALIDNLLDMSRLQTGALQPYVRATSLDEVAAIALSNVAGAEAIRVDVPEHLPLVQTDPGLLERALANLLSNALRYAGTTQPVELTAAEDTGHIVVRVIDHGPGVAEGERDRIFQPFQRLGDQDATTGIGLGLAVARGFVEAVGGSLAASETAGGGLTMSIVLPLPSVVVTRQALL